MRKARRQSELGPDPSALVTPFLTVLATIFIAELTDKDALLLLTLATRMKAWTAFAAGSLAFTITSAIIVTLGYFLVAIIPVFWIRAAGGFVMIGFAIYQYFSAEEKSEEERLVERTTKNNALSVFLGAVLMLVFLDLAGDATEVLTIVFVARYSDALLVFLGAVTSLVAASAVEVILGSNLKRFLSEKRLRVLSLIVLLTIGTIIIVTSF